ncbi:flagellar protein FliT [Brevibacillus centrosporus]|uniref:flagellar protein FliT n=1 Tax=Brevibacillus centrosporus TaxID=54910 RepID=UPI0037F7A35A
MEMMVDTLLERLLEATDRLEQAVTQKDSDPDTWLSILDEREALILQIEENAVASSALTAAQRQRLTQIHETNQRLLPLIDTRKQGVQKQINNVQRSKQAMNTYSDVGPSGYGAFFDRKK